LQLTALTELGLSYNLLRETHPHLDRLFHLQRIDLSYNRLRALPPIEGLTELRMLNLESNKMRSDLPPTAFRSLKSLTSLSLGGFDNRVRALPALFTGDLSILSLPRSMFQGRNTNTANEAAERAAAHAAKSAMGDDADDADDMIIDPFFDPRVARVRAGAVIGGRTITSFQIVSELATVGTAAQEDCDALDTIRKSQQLQSQLSRQQIAAMEEAAESDDDADARSSRFKRKPKSNAAGKAASAVVGSESAAARATDTSRGEDKVEFKGDPTLQQLPKLVTLSLQRCGLRHLPEGFGSVSSDCNVCRRVHAVGSVQFASLTALDLSNNRHLKSLPESLTRAMPRLDTLILRSCSLESLPTSLGRLSSLTSLHCSLNRLIVLPSTIGRLRQLTELDASGNPGLVDLPMELAAGCVKLRTLRLGECASLRLPDNLGDAEGLEELTVAARQVAVAADSVRMFLESGRVRVQLT
jgi:Leucine-rich repeat (LRR) protein